jgi:hypothetical protein
MTKAKWYLWIGVMGLLTLAIPARATNLPFGQVTTGTISSVAQIDRYSISVNAGDVVDFTMVATSGSLYPEIQVVDSSGTPVTGGKGTSCCNNHALEVNQVTFSAGGTYTVLASDSYSTYTGGYDIFAERMNDPPSPVNLIFGGVLLGDIAAGVQTDAYTFSANANDMIDFTATATSGSLYPRFRLSDSTGKIISSGNSCCNIHSLEMNQVKIPAAGTYYLFVNDTYDSYTGNYSVFMQRTNNPGGVVSIVFDQDQGGAIGSGVQSNAYSFGGTAGDTVSFNMVTTSGSLYPRIQVFNAAGVVQDTASSCCNSRQTQITSFKVATTGTYFVLAGDSYDSFTGNYNFSTQCFGVCLLPVPRISSLSPASAVIGSSGFMLTVNGSNFVSVNAQSVVQWNGSDLATTFVNTGQLTAAVPGSNLAVAGLYPVTVFTPAPGGGTSNTKEFTVYNPAPGASIGLAPASATAGGSAFSLTVTGTKFVPTSSVQWNGNSLPTTYVSATQLMAAVSAADIASGAACASVTVVNPSVSNGKPAGGGTSNPTCLVIDNPVPTTKGPLVPASKLVGSAAFTLTVNGTNFVPNSVVNWNNAALVTTFVSSTQLTASVPASGLTTAGTASVTVTNPAPGGGTSNPALTFTINNPKPSMTSLTPNNANAGAPSFTLTIAGKNFVSGATVQWVSGSSTTSLSIVGTPTATQIQASVPTLLIANPGTASVTVTNPKPPLNDVSSPALTFAINPSAAPTTTSLSPSSATAGGAAFKLTVNGTNFGTGCVINWNSSALSTTVASATVLTAQISASLIAAASTVAGIPVTVTCPAGTSAPPLAFIVNNPVPSVSSIAPSTMPAQGPAFTLTVNGSKFVPNSSVLWNGTALTTTFVSAAQVTAAVPAAGILAPGAAPVCVKNPAPGGGTSTPCQTFTITNPQAATPTINPTAGSFGAGLMISITDGTPGAVIYYTTNGTTPTTSSTQYKNPFLLASSATVQAIAVPSGYTQSLTASATYTIGGSAVVLALPAVNLTNSGATVQAFVNGQDLAGQVWFVFGISSTSLTSSTPTQTLGASTQRQQFKAALTGLSANTTYYFQAVATTAGGTSSGAILSFTTP